MRWLIIAVLISTAVSAQAIADFPTLFDDAQVIIGDIRYQPEIAAVDALINGNDIKFASSVEGLRQPTIILGTVCGNSWAKKVLEEHYCNMLPYDQALIVLGAFDGQPVLLITAGSPNMIAVATDWLLTRGKNYHGKFARLRGGYLPHYYTSAYHIGDGDLLTIGRPIGEVTEAIVGPQQVVKNSRTNSYLRFDTEGGRVIFGERD